MPDHLDIGPRFFAAWGRLDQERARVGSEPEGRAQVRGMLWGELAGVCGPDRVHRGTEFEIPWGLDGLLRL